MTPKEKKLFFENPLFKGLPKDFFETNRGIREAEFKKGDAVLSTESFERCLVLMLKGRVTVYKVGAQHRRVAVNTLSSGEIFGMATLFYETDYPSEVIAESACKVIIMPKDSVEHMLAASPDFAREYIVLLSEKIHFLNNKIGTFAEGEVSEKLLRFLKDYGGGKNEFELGVSVSRLAESLGAGRASIYRAFESLEERNILIRKGKTIIIKTPETA